MYDTVEIPADLAEGRRSARDRLIETLAENDDERDGAVPRGQGAVERRELMRRHPPRHPRASAHPGARAARRSRTRACSPARRGRPTTCRSPARHAGRSRAHAIGKTSRRPPIERTAGAGRPFSGAGLQDHDRTSTWASSPSSGSTRGTLDTGTMVMNIDQGATNERIGKIYQMHANKREESSTAVTPARSSRSWA